MPAFSFRVSIRTPTIIPRRLHGAGRVSDYIAKLEVIAPLNVKKIAYLAQLELGWYETDGQTYRKAVR
jgi:hypothetical protein